MRQTYLHSFDCIKWEHTVCHGRVLGEAVDDSPKRIGVEEMHGSVSHSLEHGEWRALLRWMKSTPMKKAVRPEDIIEKRERIMNSDSWLAAVVKRKKKKSIKQ